MKNKLVAVSFSLVFSVAAQAKTIEDIQTVHCKGEGAEEFVLDMTQEVPVVSIQVGSLPFMSNQYIQEKYRSTEIVPGWPDPRAISLRGFLATEKPDERFGHAAVLFSPSESRNVKESSPQDVAFMDNEWGGGRSRMNCQFTFKP